VIRLYFSHATRLRKFSLWTAMIGFGGFIVGAVEFALWVRILTELTRLPSFKEEGMTDQVRLCYVVLIGCVIGLIRLRFYP
jgi:hypothetical protein